MINLDKKKIELIITSVAGILLIVFSMRLVGKQKEYKPKISTNYQQAESPLTNEGGLEELRQYFGQLSWRRNPFKEMSLSQEIDNRDGVDLTLKGIVQKESSPRAIIGEKFLGVGDSINNYTIVRIENNFILLSEGRKIYLLYLGESLDSVSAFRD